MNINTKLKPFQTKTVNWMINQETKCGGGLLLNEPGTGKSLICIDLIIKSYVISKHSTLIVCPAGLVSNWVDEIKKHSDINENNIFIYTGNKRHKLLNEDMNNKIIVITSYNILAKEIDNNLFNRLFNRVILDEAHYIRNANGNFFKAVMEIKSNFKWIVTATPIFNTLNDMYSYVRFLELDGIDSRSEWTSRISNKNAIVSFKFINKIIKENSIRFKKCDVLKNLPAKNEIVVDLQMSGFEKEFYDTLWEYSLKRMMNISSRIRNLTGLSGLQDIKIRQMLSNNVLVYILRLKQCCNNPWLVIKTMSRLKDITDIQQATEQLAYYNLSKTLSEECPICYDNQADTIASPCGHKCCGNCWDKLLALRITTCPKCRGEISSINKLKRENTNVNTNTNTTNTETNGTEVNERDIKKSVKINKLIDIIKEKISKDEKVVIVSQWVSMLDITKEMVEECISVKSVTLQGNISIQKRADLVKNFQNDSSIKICYISLLSSAEGINLTAANNLVLLDTWWNNSKMIQVSDRIHRIGQTKTVNIYKLIINNSIETRISELINKKSKIANLIIDKWNINIKKYDSTWISSVIKLVNNENNTT